MGFDNECIPNIQSLPGEYFCAVCRLLFYPNEAVQSMCTHLYCKPCLAYVANTTRACPYDGYLVTEADAKPLVESNKVMADAIGNIMVHCLYQKSGCTWLGSLSNSSSHCSGCAFGSSLVLCNWCGIQTAHRKVHEHVQVCPVVQQVQVHGFQGSQPVAASDQVQASGQRQVVAAATLTQEQLYQQQYQQWYQQQYQQYYQNYYGYYMYPQQAPMWNPQQQFHHPGQAPQIASQHQAPYVQPAAQPMAQTHFQAQPQPQIQSQSLVLHQPNAVFPSGPQNGNASLPQAYPSVPPQAITVQNSLPQNTTGQYQSHPPHAYWTGQNIYPQANQANQMGVAPNNMPVYHQPAQAQNHFPQQVPHIFPPQTLPTMQKQQSSVPSQLTSTESARQLLLHYGGASVSQTSVMQPAQLPLSKPSLPQQHTMAPSTDVVHNQMHQGGPSTNPQIALQSHIPPKGLVHGLQKNPQTVQVHQPSTPNHGLQPQMNHHSAIALQGGSVKAEPSSPAVKQSDMERTKNQVPPASLDQDKIPINPIVGKQGDETIPNGREAGSTSDSTNTVNGVKHAVEVTATKFDLKAKGKRTVNGGEAGSTSDSTNSVNGVKHAVEVTATKFDVKAKGKRTVNGGEAGSTSESTNTVNGVKHAVEVTATKFDLKAKGKRTVNGGEAGSTSDSTNTVNGVKHAVEVTATKFDLKAKGKRTDAGAKSDQRSNAVVECNETKNGAIGKQVKVKNDGKCLAKPGKSSIVKKKGTKVDPSLNGTPLKVADKSRKLVGTLDKNKELYQIQVSRGIRSNKNQPLVKHKALSFHQRSCAPSEKVPPGAQQHTNAPRYTPPVLRPHRLKVLSRTPPGPVSDLPTEKGLGAYAFSHHKSEGPYDNLHPSQVSKVLLSAPKPSALGLRDERFRPFPDEQLDPASLEPVGLRNLDGGLKDFLRASHTDNDVFLRSGADSSGSLDRGIDQRLPLRPHENHGPDFDVRPTSRFSQPFNALEERQFRRGQGSPLNEYFWMLCRGSGPLDHSIGGDRVGTNDIKERNIFGLPKREFEGHGNLQMGEMLRDSDIIGQDDVPNHIRGGDLFGQHGLSSLSKLKERVDFDSSARRPGDPGFRSKYTLQGFPSDGGSFPGDGGPFQNSRKRATGAVKWCNICKAECETVEGSDLHYQVKEHQHKSMDKVLMTQQNAKKLKKAPADSSPLSIPNKMKKSDSKVYGRKKNNIP